MPEDSAIYLKLLQENPKFALKALESDLRGRTFLISQAAQLLLQDLESPETSLAIDELRNLSDIILQCSDQTMQMLDILRIVYKSEMKV